MANHALLNNVDHGEWRVIARPSAVFGDDVSSVLTFPTEFADMQRTYPIFFRKRPGAAAMAPGSGARADDYYAVALLGFEDGENLFLDEGKWCGGYVPGVIARGPFLIGFQDRLVDGVVQREPVIHVDLDSPRLSRTEGEPIFRQHGGNSAYLDRVVMILDGIQRGIAANAAMFAMFDTLGLIEPVSIEIETGMPIGITLTNLYTIDERRFAGLGGPELAELNAAGFLQAAVLVMSSLGNVSAMIDRRLARQARSRAT